MKPEEIAYLAGLFDGEGSVGNIPYKATKNGAKYNRVVLRITNTHKGVLDWAVGVTGVGCVIVEPKRGDSLICYKYSVSNAKAVTLLRTIRPFLKIKADQADRVLAGKMNGRVQEFPSQASRAQPRA